MLVAGCWVLDAGLCLPGAGCVLGACRVRTIICRAVLCRAVCRVCTGGGHELRVHEHHRYGQLRGLHRLQRHPRGSVTTPCNLQTSPRRPTHRTPAPASSPLSVTLSCACSRLLLVCSLAGCARDAVPHPRHPTTPRSAVRGARCTLAPTTTWPCTTRRASHVPTLVLTACLSPARSSTGWGWRSRYAPLHHPRGLCSRQVCVQPGRDQTRESPANPNP